MSKKRILMITQSFYPEIGSAGNRMKNIYQLLTSNGYDVKVLTSEASYPNRDLYKDRKFWNDESLNHNEDIHFIKIKSRKYSRKMFNRLLYYLEITLKMIYLILFSKKKFDLIFVSSPPIFLGFAGLIAKLKYKADIILDVRDLWPESLKGVGVFNWKWAIWLFTQFEKLLYKQAKFIVVNSPSFSQHIQKLGKRSQQDILYLPNGARTVEIQSLKTNDNEFRAIYTGNIGLAQDVLFLKELTLKLNEAKIHTSIIGYGIKKEELKQFVKDQKLTYITFQNPITREECLALNREHAVGILVLNDKEVFDTVLPGKLIDYMTCNLPLVASVSGISKQLIEDTNIGKVSKNRNVKEVVSAIEYLKNNPDVHKKMQLNCSNLVRRDFLWEDNIHILLERLEGNRNSIQSTILKKVKNYE